MRRAALPFRRPTSIAAEAARVLAANGIVAWFQGRSEHGPRALGHRSLLAHPGDPRTTARMNDIKGREQFRPIAPMVLADRAAEVFEGYLPSPYMLFVHTVRPHWRERIPAVVHVDGTARAQTVDAQTSRWWRSWLTEFERLTGLPALIEHLAEHGSYVPSWNTLAGGDGAVWLRIGGVDLLAIGPYAVHRRTYAAP